jgi:hypothetical protein
VLKLRDRWVLFEREKLLPRSYNLPVGTLVAVMVGLGLKDDAKTSLQSCPFGRLRCRDWVLALVLVYPRRPNFQSYPPSVARKRLRPPSGGLLFGRLFVPVHTGKFASLCSQRHPRPDYNNSERRAQASRCDAVDAGANDCRRFVHATFLLPILHRSAHDPKESILYLFARE